MRKTRLYCPKERTISCEIFHEFGGKWLFLRKSPANRLQTGEDSHSSHSLILPFDNDSLRFVPFNFGSISFLYRAIIKNSKLKVL